MPFAHLRCLFTAPELYQVFNNAATYTPSSLESAATWALSWARTIRTMCSVLSPVLAIVLYRRSFFTSLDAPLSAVIYVSIFYTVCLTMRTIGRAGNVEYLKFMHVWEEASGSPTRESKALLAVYDYESWARPIEHEWVDNLSPKRRQLDPQHDYTRPSNAVLAALQSAVSYAAAHTIGMSLMFPGTWFSEANPALLEGRRKLIEAHGAQRASVRSRLGDSIDTVFIDRSVLRARVLPNRRSDGATQLVITCEGNCGFYEVGVGSLAATSTYCVLAWNTPGFAGSGGVPWPDNVGAGIDVVLQYAVHKLHFAPEQIIIFSWSIGGYAATHIGMQYPTLGGIVLDATFEDVLPLARTVLPASLQGIVHETVRTYLDLANGRQMCKYAGPLTIIRRTNDEMITSAPQVQYTLQYQPHFQGTPAERLAGNRSNNLLVILLRHRYPELFIADDGISEDTFVLDRLHDYVTAPDSIHRALIESQIDTRAARAMLAMGVHEKTMEVTMPSSALLTAESRAHMCIFLAAHYMHNVDIGHNDKLPIHMLQTPEHPWK